MPVAATMPNMHRPAPPSTACGIDATTSPIFGNSPKASRMPPDTATTKRLRTPVMPTSPTFCENDVYGNVLKTPPMTVPRPSVASPRARSPGPIRLPQISPSARNIPVDSTITTTITMHSETIGPISNVGAPKRNG